MRHYLDFAATSAVRPDGVVDAVTRFLRECGATPGRSGHARALDAGRMALACRRAVCAVLGVEGDPGRLAFLSNATYALNTALGGLLRSGDAVVYTSFDHNAVLRPLHRLEAERGIELRPVAGRPDGTLDLDRVREALQGARLLVVNAVSNVFGTALPTDDLAALAREAGARSLVDAAQAVGHRPVDFGADGFDVVSFTGHKGLLGPQGTGGLWVRPGIELDALAVGGGGASESREAPAVMPARLEAGTLNAPGLAGLLAGCEYVLERRVESIEAHERELAGRLVDGLSGIPGVRILSPTDGRAGGVVTFLSRDVDPATLALRLDRDFGVAGRPGLHCAPEAHRLLGTLDTGALRLSVGWSTRTEDIEAAIRAVGAVCSDPLAA